MSNKTSKPQTKSTIHESLLSHTKYADPLKKQPAKFQGSIDDIMNKKRSPGDEDPTMETKPKNPYKGSIYDMIKKHPPAKKPQKSEDRKQAQKPVFREDSPPLVTPPVINAKAPTPKAPAATTRPQKVEAAQPKKEQVVSPQWTGIAPGSSVGSVSRTLSLFG